MERLLAQNRLANKWQNQDLNTGSLATVCPLNTAK